jgi:phosphinothricin acetyltransferase
VDFNHHRIGIASALMEHALEHCLTVNFKTLLAFLYGHNERSIRFLNKFGFEQWGVLPDTAIVDGKTYDHVIYGKHLTSG